MSVAFFTCAPVQVLASKLAWIGSVGGMLDRVVSPLPSRQGRVAKFTCYLYTGIRPVVAAEVPTPRKYE